MVITDIMATKDRHEYGVDVYESGLVLLMLLASSAAMAGEWDLTPRLTMGETYTDNVDQDPPGDEKSDLVTEISPGFSARRQGGRIEASLDYSLQALHSVRDNNLDINHRLLGLATAELVRDHGFLDADASIGQVLISARQSDNLLRSNRTDVITYGLSPYWLQDFGGYAKAQARYRYDAVLVEEGASDSETHTVTLDLDSGRRFTVLTWDLSYSYRQLQREDGEDDRRQEGIGNLGFRVTEDLSLLARAGYEQSDVTTAQEVQNGFFWSLGANWNPSRFIDATVLYGPNDKEFRFRSSPTRRTSLEITYNKRDVGVNPQERWSGSLTQRTRYSTWTARYTEESTNQQQLLIEQPFLSENNTIFDQQGQVIDLQNSLSLTNNEFFRRRFDASVGYSRGRSQFTVGAFYEKREFAIGRQNEKGFGSGVSWSRRIAPRTSSLLGVDWRRDEFEEDNRQDDRWNARASLSHTFTQHVDGFIEYQHIRRDSTESDQDFRENRIRLFVTMAF